MASPARRLIGSRLAGELPAIATLTASEGAARLLSFCFYLLAARELTTAGFGVVRYTIVLSVLAFGVTQVLSNALTREMGAARGDAQRTAEMLGSGLLLAGGVLAASLGLCLVAAATGLTDGADTVGLLAAVVGMASFQLYYGIGRGVGEQIRPATTYVAGSFIQLAALGVLAAVASPSARTVLILFGLSSLVPIVLWELRRPLLRRRSLALSGAATRAVVRLATPLLLAEFAYLIWLSADQIWIQHTFGASQVGIYSAAKNLGQILFVIPAGTTAVLMPRIAELHTRGDARHARRLVWAATVGALVVCGLIGLVMVIVREPLLGGLYGQDYRAGAESLAILTIGSVTNAGFVVLTASAVGWGRPAVYTTAMVLAAGCELIALAVLSSDRVTTAAWAVSGSITIALVAVALYMLARPFRGGGASASRPAGRALSLLWWAFMALVIGRRSTAAMSGAPDRWARQRERRQR
jgi:O-antigen/teichoic acid export membrane protein